jgi:hypothetical protein
MKLVTALFSLSLCAASVACTTLAADATSPRVLTTLHGQLDNPQSVTVSGAIRVALIWRGTNGGNFSVAEDLPVQPVFPSAFKVDIDGPPPADAMIPGTELLKHDDIPPSDIPPDFQYAYGTAVAYIDLNGNGKLDFVDQSAQSYVDEIVGANESMLVVYLQGTLPGGNVMRDSNGAPPTLGYSLYEIPDCQPSLAIEGGAPPSGAAGGCQGGPLWHDMSFEYEIPLSADPRFAELMCSGDPTTTGSASGSGDPQTTNPGPSPASQCASAPGVAQDTYPPYGSCGLKGAWYTYSECKQVSLGPCKGTVGECNLVTACRPSPVPSNWPCPSN